MTALPINEEVGEDKLDEDKIKQFGE